MTTNKYCGTTSETVVIETDICCTNVDTATTAYLGSAATADDVMAAIENVTAINSSSATLIKESSENLYEAIDDLDKIDSGNLGDLHYEEEHRVTHLGLGLYGLFSEGVASVKRGYRRYKLVAMTTVTVLLMVGTVASVSVFLVRKNLLSLNSQRRHTLSTTPHGALLGDAVAMATTTPSPRRTVSRRCDKASINYTGHVSMTISRRVCQPWISQLPHTHDYPLKERHNYCRDPTNDGYLWCLTMDPHLRWETCSVDLCAPEEDPCSTNPCTGNTTCQQYNSTHYECVCTGSNCPNRYAKCKAANQYAGHVSVTSGGFVCQAWREQYPHQHQEGSVNKRFTTGETVITARNYCRDAGGSDSYTWCYTTDPDIRWQRCFVDLCGFEENLCASNPCTNNTICQQYNSYHYECLQP